ncbi:MAG TPA: protein-disulfide reductase DsbD domain-containing protein [Thermoanaerobaculia bacterium]|nr:protein-disulfide reductase DsbD domain-containing protein [Thermoanaerobaculia bacterium]
MTPFRPAFLALAAATLLGLTGGASVAWGAASDWAVNEQSRVRLITPDKVASPSGELRFGLHFTLAPGWHVYWKNSGDAGFPPVVEIQEPKGLGEPEILWPAPHRFELPGDLVAFGYEDEVVYPVRAALPSGGATGDRLDLSVEVDYLVCEVDCIPYRYTLKLAQPLGAQPEPDPETGALFQRWVDSVPAPVERLPGVSTDGALVAGTAPALEVRVRGASGDPAGVGLFLESQDTFNTGKPEARTDGDGLVIRVPLQLLDAGKPLPQTATFAWTVTGLKSADGRPVSFEARREVRQQSAPQTPEAQPAGGWSWLREPRVAALLVVVLALLALNLWGLLAVPLPPSLLGARGLVHGVLGFVATGLAVWLLSTLSRQVSSAGLAAVELALLGMALFAWLWHRSAGKSGLKFVLALGLALCAATVPWLADRNRLSPTPGAADAVETASSSRTTYGGTRDA